MESNRAGKYRIYLLDTIYAVRPVYFRAPHDDERDISRPDVVAHTDEIYRNLPCIPNYTSHVINRNLYRISFIRRYRDRNSINTNK